MHSRFERLGMEEVASEEPPAYAGGYGDRGRVHCVRAAGVDVPENTVYREWHLFEALPRPPFFSVRRRVSPRTLSVHVLFALFAGGPFSVVSGQWLQVWRHEAGAARPGKGCMGDELKATSERESERDDGFRTRPSLIARLRDEEAVAWNSAWDEFYGIYGRAVRRYVQQLGADPADAEDVVQEVFVKIRRNLAGFEYDPAIGRFLGWINTITRTTVVSYLRRKQVRATREIRLDPGDGAENAIEQVPDPAGHEADSRLDLEVIRSARATALGRLQRRMGDAVFQAFRLHGLEAHPVEEVAGRLGITVNAVHVYTHRVMKMLEKEVATILRQDLLAGGNVK